MLLAGGSRMTNAELSTGQSRILAMIAAGAPLQETLDALLRLIEANAPDLIGSILLASDDGLRLVHGSAPGLPAAFVREIDGAPIGPRTGSCGTAMHRREPVIVEDIATDPLWDGYRATALAHGLHACWSTPIFDPQRNVLGSFALYYRKPTRPPEGHRLLVEMATDTAAIAIVRHRGEEERLGLVRTLGERVKELTVLHEASRLLQQAPAADQTLIARLAALLPDGLQFPEIGRTRIVIGEIAVTTPGWRETPWILSAPVKIQGEHAGAIDLAYVKEPPVGARAPFLDEERSLLDSVASILGAQIERIRVQAALRDRESIFRSVFESAAIGMTMVGMDQRFLRVNPSFARMLGYSVEELRGRSFAEFTLAEDQDENARLYSALVAGEIDHFQIDKRYRRRDGAVVLVRVTVSRVPQEDSSTAFTIGMIEDITERKRGEADLQRFRAAMDASGDAILLVDRTSMRYVDVNRTFCELVGYSREEMLGMTPMELFSADRETLERDYDAIIADKESAASRTEGHYRHKNGGLIPIETRRRALRTKDGWIIVGTARDITERKRAERRIEHLATHDGLTDLPNRNLIHDRITQAVEHVRRTDRQLAVLFIDLDRFKVINDGFGHPFGDAVLRAAGERLSGVVRSGDTVARQGGDEFLILLSDLRKSTDVYLVAQKILDAFAQPFRIEEREVYLGASIGISVFPQDGESADVLIGNADVAMYRAKDLGRNTYQFFTRDMSDETQRRVELETRLRVAVQNNELRLAFQPKVNLVTGDITGCEALLRWRHPELGEVPPARFIPVAEESGQIVAIGDWVLRAACTQNKAWLDAGLPPVCVAVNVSARQFMQQDVVAWVLRTLEETGLPPRQLELEFTESLIAQDAEKVISAVDQLKAAGVRLSIDDFGTGYSSLSYLKRFRVDTLKIDQSFVRNMLNEQNDATIALAIISLAHNLGFKVIAEGVETDDHCRFLRLNRCDEIQGYHFSRPVPAAELEAMLRAGKRLA